MPSELHNFLFKRNRDNPDLWFGHCSCGWNAIGSEERVKFLAAGHDLDWESYPPVGQFEAGAMRRDER